MAPFRQFRPRSWLSKLASPIKIDGGLLSAIFIFEIGPVGQYLVEDAIGIADGRLKVLCPLRDSPGVV